jgi:DNA-binding transcriptional ArsR family regulator
MTEATDRKTGSRLMMTKGARSELKAPDRTAPELVKIGAMVGCVEEAARLLRLLANERRLLILCFLATSGEMSVGALVEALGLSQSALSQHLAKLRREGLVHYRRESQTLIYRLADPRTVRVLSVLKDIFGSQP